MKTPNLKEPSGLSLSEPRLLTRKISFCSPFFFYFPLLLLGTAGSLGCFYTALPIPVDLWPLAIGNLLLAPLSTLLFLQKKARSLPIFLPPLLLATAVFLGREPLWQGLLRTINLVISAYSQKSGLSMLLIPLVKISPQLERNFLTVWGLMMSFLLQWGLGWALVRKHSSLSAFLLSGFFVAVPMVASILPHRLALVLLLLFWGSLLVFRPIFHGQEGLYRTGRRYSASGAAGARISALPLLLALGLLMAALSAVIPRATYQRPQLTEDLRSGFISQGGTGTFFRGGGLGGSSTRVDLIAAGDRKYTGKVMLRVKTDKPVSDYLKGFAGSVYTGTGWELLGEEQSKQLGELSEEGQAQLFQGQLFEEFPKIESSIYGYYHLEVQQVGTNPRQVYLPYGLAAASVAGSSFEPVGDSFFRAEDRLFGIKEYSVNAFWEPSSSYSSFGARLGQSLLLTQTAEKYPGGLSSFLEAAEKSYRFFDREEDWFPTEVIVSYMPEEAAALTRSLSTYAPFAKEAYTQLPESTRTKLNLYLKEHGLLLENFYDSADLARAVIAQVQADCSYTLTPGKTPEGKDFALYFLLESRKGYCVHFATAVTALLRAAGVPARYAEGYVVPPGQASGEWSTLLDSNAHAWPEIFLTGMGWTPIEATPGMDFTGQADPSRGPEEESTPLPSPSPTVEPSPSEGPSPQPSQPAGPTPSPAGPSGPGELREGMPPALRTVLLAVLFAAAFLFLCGFLLFLRRKYTLSAREKRFRQKDSNLAALSLYAYLQDLLRWGRRFCLQIPQEPPKALEKLALKARFSQHKLTPEELALFQKEVNSLTALLGQKLTRLQNWYCRYLLALY